MREIALFEKELPITPIQELSGAYDSNQYYVKRDDLLPFCFGGNKVRKAYEFYQDIKKQPIDVIMTYGSNSSNHCRIIANMAVAMGIFCHIISPEENRTVLYNTKLVTDFGAEIETCPVERVAETIRRRIEAYEKQGKRVYFIQGGGHGNLGTEGYVKAYREILAQQEHMGIQFDYIFHASGTGATQAGLVCGRLLAEKSNAAKIVGISIARDADRGREVVKQSIQEYLADRYEALYKEDVLVFTEQYRCGGYGKFNQEIEAQICKVMYQEGIPMDTTYVGKAFWGMQEYINTQNIRNKNILFIHTGGTPLYFDRL